MTSPSFARFDEFYAYYLASHSHVWNRRVHLAGWILGLALSAWGMLTSQWLATAIAAPVGLGVALLGHRFIERNDSVVFSYPWWTARADLRMFADMARGRLPC